jgi:DNA sulfur modification protein DndB
MLGNILPLHQLTGLARRRRKQYRFRSVPNALVEDEVASGWEVLKRNRASTRLRRLKPAHEWFEDRVWSLLYRMGFLHMSGDKGATRGIVPSDERPENQIDVVAFDDEVALLVECKSVVEPRRLANFCEVLAKIDSLRETFRRTLEKQYPPPVKRKVVGSLFTQKVAISDNDRARAAAAGVVLFEDVDLAYYEALVSQIDAAARFQFLADLLPEKEVPGLTLRIPAVKTKMGGYTCYGFSISPEYLLKISYVSHRAKGKPSDVDTYQRMLKRSRLASIRAYISEDGIFPTNIVVNIPERMIRFEKARQDVPAERAVVGWVHLRPTYKTAWIIDGQHRLFAYASHPAAAKSTLAVLAFVGLPASEQARLFVDINAEQRKVKQSLLQELYAELHADAADPELRVRAVLSKALLSLDADPVSPFSGRILKADESRTLIRCISLTSMFRALEKTGFFVARGPKGLVVYGPLWAHDNHAMVRRATAVVKGWFDGIKAKTPEVWAKGSDEGGGLAMNDGVAVCINVLRSVLQHLQAHGYNLPALSDSELVNVVAPFATSVGRYFASLNELQLRMFRALRGNEGQTTGVRRCQEAIRGEHPSFNPPGLADYLERQRSQTNERANGIILKIEAELQRTVLEELKRELGETEAGWWFNGVPVRVRKKVDDRINEEGGKRGGREQNFDLIDYKEIVLQNWLLFKDSLARGGGAKDALTKWIVEVNDIRKTAMHASRGAHLPVTEEQVAFLEEVNTWLVGQITEA